MNINTPLPVEPITRPSRQVARVSDPSLRYMSALYDPRTCAEEPSVPHSTALSQKVKCFSRGSFNTGSTGYGFVAVAPFIAAVSDLSPITTSVTSSSMTASTLLSSVAAVANANTNSPYTSSSIGTGSGKLQYRLVGGALYVKYAGTELNRGGDMILFEESNHTSVFNYTYNTALGQDYAKRVPVSGDVWQWVSFTPNNLSECEYSAITGSAPYLTPILAVIVNSAGATQPFDYEFFGWYEFTGQAARGATASYDDVIGFSAVTGAANQFQQLDSVLGIDGFLHSVNNQMDNFSGVSRSATHQQNFAGLAAFLPQILSVAKRAGGALAKEFLPGLASGGDPEKKKAVKQLVKAVVKGKPSKPKPKAK